MIAPHKGIALLMGEPDDEDEPEAEHDDGDEEGPSSEEHESAKRGAMSALIKAIHEDKDDAAVEAFDTLLSLCQRDGDEPEESSPDMGDEEDDEGEEERP